MDPFSSALFGAAGGKAIESLFPSKQQDPLEAIRLGNGLDLDSQKKMFDYRIDRGLESGMTPYEMFMGPAANGGGGTTGSGQTLGNAYSQMNQLKKQQSQEIGQRAADRATELQKVKMQTDAQKEIAGVSAGAQKYSSDIQKAIADGRLGFDRNVYQKTTAPQAALQMGLTTQQILKASNDVATSKPKFVKLLKLMSMGSENILATMISNGLPIDITDPAAVKAMSKQQTEQVIATIMSLLSSGRKEMTGITQYFRDLIGGYHEAGLPHQPSLGNNQKNNGLAPRMGRTR